MSAPLFANAARVGVLTFHRCINYGSYWQARVLVEALRARGLGTVLLDHRSRRVDFAEWRCAFRPQLPAAPVPTDYPLIRRKIEKFSCAFEQLPLSQPFDLDTPDAMESFDAVVVGSDEVWNFRHPWYHGKLIFFGDVRAPRLVAYAASFGNQTDELGAWWAEKLRRFDAISVRDANSQRIMQSAWGTAPPLVLDPCLQWETPLEGAWRGPQTPFLLVYGHNFSSAFIENVRRMATVRGLPVISIGYRNDWADEQWLDAGPHDFAGAMARAQGVATNFFHGCVFALANQKPFACETSDYRFVKVRDLMQTVGAQRHLVSAETPPCDFEALLSEPLEGAIGERLETLRSFSSRFLDEALKPLFL